jgi:hypothetical protein
MDLKLLDVHVRPHLGAPLRQVPRGLKDPLGSDGSLINDVNRRHHPLLVRKPEPRHRNGAVAPAARHFSFRVWMRASRQTPERRLPGTSSDCSGPRLGTLASPRAKRE